MNETISKPAEDPKGLFMIYTGHGKGKTTAALGLAFRAMGRKQKVAMIQFLKGKWMTGERMMAEQLPLLELYVMGLGFTWDSSDLSQDQAAARKAWQQVQLKLEDPEIPIVICDEISYALNYGFIEEAEVQEVIRKRPPLKHLLFTGRHMPDSLIEMADLVTTMTSVKHPFDQGRKAVAAIDF